MDVPIQLNQPELVLVEITDGNTRDFAFYCRPEVAEAFGAARALDFERAYGGEFTYLVTAP